MEDYINENEDKNFLLGGDFNTVLDTNIDKHNGKNDTHKRCRTKINHIIDTYDLIDIWREKHCGLREYTWHSSHRPPIFCRLDYFLVSENVRNFVISCKHNISYKSDHCPVSITLDLSQHFRDPGYFKMNNSLLLNPDYQEIIRESINETTTINADANPNTLWELIKGTIRNETIKYAAKNKKETNKQEHQLTKDIDKLKQDLTKVSDVNRLEIIKESLNEKVSELESIIENKINGFILRSKANVIEHNEKNSKYFASLEKKKSKSKLISRLTINNQTTTDQTKILKATDDFYKKPLQNERI